MLEHEGPIHAPPAQFPAPHSPYDAPQAQAPAYAHQGYEPPRAQEPPRYSAPQAPPHQAAYPQQAPQPPAPVEPQAPRLRAAPTSDEEHAVAIPLIHGLDRPYRVEIALEGEIRVSGELKSFSILPTDTPEQPPADPENPSS